MSDSHKYRVEVPNVVDDMDLSVYAFRLYAHIKRVAGDRGYCREGTREMAERCRMGAASVSRAKAELLAAGLITVTEFKGGDEMRVINIWRKNLETFAPPDSEEEQSVPQGNEVFPQGTIRSNREQSVPQGNTPPDPPIRSEGTKQEPHKEPNEDPHTNRARAAADAGVCVSMPKHSKEILRRYAAVHTDRQGKPLGEGWVTEAFRTGEWNEAVGLWLESLEPERRARAFVERKPEPAKCPPSCPLCFGSGTEVVPGKGARRCPNLVERMSRQPEQARAHAPP